MVDDLTKALRSAPWTKRHRRCRTQGEGRSRGDADPKSSPRWANVRDARAMRSRRSVPADLWPLPTYREMLFIK